MNKLQKKEFDRLVRRQMRNKLCPKLEARYEKVVKHSRESISGIAALLFYWLFSWYFFIWLNHITNWIPEENFFAVSIYFWVWLCIMTFAIYRLFREVTWRRVR